MSLEPYVYPVSPSPQVRLVRDYIQYLSAFDLDKLSGLTTDNFTQQMLPASLGVAPRTKAEDLAFLKELQAQRNGTPIHYTVYKLNDGASQTWAYTKLDTYNLDVVYFFHFGEENDGHKIDYLGEFVDSKTYSELFPTTPASSSEPST